MVTGTGVAVSPRGGKRPGAGRKPVEEKQASIVIRVTIETEQEKAAFEAMSPAERRLALLEALRRKQEAM